MPQPLRFRGVLRGSPPGTHEQTEVGGAEGCVHGAPARGSHCPPRELRDPTAVPGFPLWCSWAEVLGRCWFCCFLPVLEGSRGFGPPVKPSTYSLGARVRLHQAPPPWDFLFLEFCLCDLNVIST